MSHETPTGYKPALDLDKLEAAWRRFSPADTHALDWAATQRTKVLALIDELRAARRELDRLNNPWARLDTEAPF
ncbi:hypothetical protein [uncultured Thermomonospora sp.]|jgi:hypothetical protein|uniref:hypothetical protein n=1 Tax=uncultured Thermomonospora sp. TaxID=671175 RepID=UPI00259B7937|nr:hypothetical protein [uncultured Thermomonospora sp.]